MSFNLPPGSVVKYYPSSGPSGFRTNTSKSDLDDKIDFVLSFPYYKTTAQEIESSRILNTIEKLLQNNDIEEENKRMIYETRKEIVEYLRRIRNRPNNSEQRSNALKKGHRFIGNSKTCSNPGCGAFLRTAGKVTCNKITRRRSKSINSKSPRYPSKSRHLSRPKSYGGRRTLRNRR